ncbi:MAG: hypothetical protein V3U84_01475 [Thiotrichaceae bacterium]
MDRYIAPAISAFTTSMWIMQKVGRRRKLKPRNAIRQVAELTVLCRMALSLITTYFLLLRHPSMDRRLLHFVTFRYSGEILVTPILLMMDSQQFVNNTGDTL